MVVAVAIWVEVVVVVVEFPAIVLVEDVAGTSVDDDVGVTIPVVVVVADIPVASGDVVL